MIEIYYEEIQVQANMVCMKYSVGKQLPAIVKDNFPRRYFLKDISIKRGN